MTTSGESSQPGQSKPHNENDAFTMDQADTFYPLGAHNVQPVMDLLRANDRAIVLSVLHGLSLEDAFELAVMTQIDLQQSRQQLKQDQSIE